MGVKIDFDGKLLKMLMIEHGVTQTKLQDVTGVKQATISKYINGAVKNPDFGVIQTLAEYFSVHPNEFAKKPR
tara:strand:- start:577 stop:795 length:219 start_codon:yes stop_codon:yes gene_type:complete